jgi:hypothetical protein
MRGIPDFNFPAFDAKAAELRAQGHIVFSPADGDRWLELTGRPVDPRVCFELDTQWICREADAVALLPGWENSKGARAERALAEALGLDVWEVR